MVTQNRLPVVFSATVAEFPGWSREWSNLYHGGSKRRQARPTRHLLPHRGAARGGAPLWSEPQEGQVRQDEAEPLVKNLELARWLGFKHPHRIKELISRNNENLGVLTTVVETSGKRGGRPGTTYYLTEEQALFIVTRSETPRAVALIKVSLG